MPSHRNPKLRTAKRTYNWRLVRQTLSYSIQEIAELFGLHPNAVRRWLKTGLTTIDDRRPLFIHGSDLIAFLRERQENRKRRCAADEMYCCRCRAPRRPAGGRVEVERVNARRLILRGHCELCGIRMNRGGAVDQLSMIERAFTITTAPTSLERTAGPLVMCELTEGP